MGRSSRIEFILGTAACLAALLLVVEPAVTTKVRDDPNSTIPLRIHTSQIHSRECLHNESFPCHDGRCIPLAWRCDGDLDCKDEEDEKNCPMECQENEHKCGGEGNLRTRTMTLKCIPKRWVCDGEQDCQDHSDERNCKDVKCDADTQFKCEELDGQFELCIPLTWVCDGQRDCSGGQDEKNCTEKKCSKDDFSCSNGNCIYKSWRCDGEDDCGDGSDEMVGEPSQCNKTTSQCDEKTMFKCKSGHCIPKLWKCDGEIDCMDRSDEHNCTQLEHKCQFSEEFACHSSDHCINKLWVCDGEEDCPDGSDEQKCKDTPTECTEGLRKCPSTFGNYGSLSGHVICIPESSWCNGFEDCPDGGDERGCNATSVDECKEGIEYKCPSTPLQCQNYTDLCKNSKFDCGDGNLSVCNKRNNFCAPGADGCDCRNSYVKGFSICHCKAGYKLLGDKCIDIDECKQPGTCDQTCHNTPGSYVCSCQVGYKLSIDPARPTTVPSRCRAMGGDPLVLLSNRATIRQFDIVTKNHMPLISSPGTAVAMDFHLTNGTLVWSDISAKKILMCRIGNDSNPHHILTGQKCDENHSVVVSDQVNTPDGLAIDWIHNLLFWTDGGFDQINVMNLDTGKRRVIFHSDLEEPRAIAVDPELGLLFWTDWGKEAKIERSGMDGSNRVIIVQGDRVKWPNGLALDYVDKRVFWADAKIKSIFSCDYWGKDIKTVLHSHNYLRHPFSMSVFEDRVYYTDWEHDGVITVNKFTGGDVQKVMDNVVSPMTVRIYHRQAQPMMQNKCAQSSCDEICLPRAVYREGAKSEENEFHGRPFTCACEGKVASDMFLCMENLIQGSSGFSFFTTTLFFLMVAGLVVGAVYAKKRYANASFAPLRFDNPVYRRGDGNDAEMDDPFSNPGLSVGPGQLPRLVIADADPEASIHNPVLNA